MEKTEDINLAQNLKYTRIARDYANAIIEKSLQEKVKEDKQSSYSLFSQRTIDEKLHGMER